MGAYDKAAVKEILMRRDGETEESAQEIIDSCQEEINNLVEQEGTTLEDLEDVIACDLSLEPDYLMDFLPL